MRLQEIADHFQVATLPSWVLVREGKVVHIEAGAAHKRPARQVLVAICTHLLHQAEGRYSPPPLLTCMHVDLHAFPSWLTTLAYCLSSHSMSKHSALLLFDRMHAESIPNDEETS